MKIRYTICALTGCVYLTCQLVEQYLRRLNKKQFSCIKCFNDLCLHHLTFSFEHVIMPLNAFFNGFHGFNFTHGEFEYFDFVYSNPCIDWSLVGIYLFGIINCVGLALVSWFERSGQAGPHRTLLNRLNSLTLDQVSKY